MKKFSILLILALLAAFIAAPGASAQSITWSSGFQVQNLGTATANIVINYYNQDGTNPIAPVSDQIPAGGSVTYVTVHAPEGFNGSVVVEGDQPIVAIANTLGNFPQYQASTESFPAGETEVSLPLIMRGNSGFYTWFNVQNAGSGDANVTVEYVPGSHGNAYTEPAVTIAPGAAHTFNQRDLSQLGTKFIGSAVVTSTNSEPIVATVMQVGETYKILLGYNGFTDESTTVNMPLIMSNNSGYYTAFQVQNAGGSNTTINIEYGKNLAGSWQPTAESASLDPDESATFQQNTGQFATQKYVGSATITSAEPIVVIVNQSKLIGTPVGTSYKGFDPDKATSKVSAPLIMANNSGYYTGVQVMNVGTSATTITLDYGPNGAGTYDPPNETETLQPGDSYNTLQNDPSKGWGSNRYVGSLTVTASGGGQIVMIVNEQRNVGNEQGDEFMTYAGFNH
jgi:hypothetical protein